MTYNQLKDAVWRVSSALARYGMKKNDVLMIIGRNSPEYIIMFLAAAAVGAVTTTVNPDYLPGAWIWQDMCDVYCSTWLVPYDIPYTSVKNKLSDNDLIYLWFQEMQFLQNSEVLKHGLEFSNQQDNLSCLDEIIFKLERWNNIRHWMQQNDVLMIIKA